MIASILNAAVATRVRSSLGQVRLVTSDFVLGELLGFLCESGPFLRAEAVRLTDRVRSDPTITVEPATSALFEAGLRLYEARPDKGYSLVDCTSMVIMRERGIDGLGMAGFMEPGSLVMERKMLHGIKERAERLAATPAEV